MKYTIIKDGTPYAVMSKQFEKMIDSVFLNNENFKDVVRFDDMTLNDICFNLRIINNLNVTGRQLVCENAAKVIEDLKKEMCNLNEMIARLKAKCDEYERQPEMMAETAKKALELIKSQDARIALLEKALKPVIEINLEGLTKFEGIDYEELLTAIVADAQRIMKEVGVN